MPESRFSRAATITTIAISLGALLVTALAYFATRPSTDQTYEEAIGQVCAKAKASYISPDAATKTDGYWDKDLYLVYFDQLLANSGRRQAELQAIEPPSTRAEEHAQALAAYQRLHDVERSYRDQVAAMTEKQMGRAGPGWPGDLDPSEWNAAVLALRSELVAISGDRCGV